MAAAAESTSASAPVAGAASVAAPLPLQDDIHQYLQHLRVERRLATRSLTIYTEAFGTLQRFADAQPVPLREVQQHHVRRWAGQLHAQGLQSRSIALALSAWRGLYRALGRQGHVSANPVDGVRAPKAARPLPKALAVDQAVAFVEAPPAAATDPVLAARDQCVLELLYGCGLRVAELAGLDVAASATAVGWVDAADATVHVLGKGGKPRSVPVGGAALRALAAWLEVRGAMAAAGEPALFVSRRGTRLTTGQVRSRVALRAVQAGVPTHVHPHMLRHSFASHMLQSSSDLRGVQELLGHASIVSTQVYTRLDFGHLSQVYDAAHPRAKRK